MTAADLIQILMKDENIDKDIMIVQLKPAVVERGWRPQELVVEDVVDFGSTLQLMVELPECDSEHSDGDCQCDCVVCERCEW